jgi:phospholipid transport system substrate-binding protein
VSRHPGSSALLRIVANLSVALTLALGALSARAQGTAAGAADVVRAFYVILRDTMVNGPTLGASGRYAKLEPVVHKTFDVPFMARLATGPLWTSLSPLQQQRLIQAFDRYISATYADRFNEYSGEKLEVGADRPFGADVVVPSRIVAANGKPVNINYLMHRNGATWQVLDIYLDGTISELATLRSEFSSILRRQGVGGLIATLNRKADLLSAPAVGASRPPQT